MLEESGFGLFASSSSDNLVGTVSGRERVQLLHHVVVLERVLLALVMDFLRSLDGIELALDLVRVNDPGQIGAINRVALKLITSFVLTFLSIGAKDFVKRVEGALSIDHKSTKVATRSELEQVKSTHAASVNTRKIPCNTLDIRVAISVDKERSLAHCESGVTVLSVTSTHLL